MIKILVPASFVPLSRRLALPLAGASLALVLSGCGAGLSGTPSSLSPNAIPVLHGTVHGGQQPVGGATIQLYAAGTTGLNSASVPLLNSVVTTDANGGFNISSRYTCPGASQVYITATGGNPGLAPGTNNTAIQLVTALGPCVNLSPTTFISINEVTTVAAAYALSGFTTDISHVGAPNANLIGLANAFLNASSVADPTSGVSPGSSLPATATAPVAEINTLGNILSACVNSAGPNSTPCSSLFADTTVVNVTPANTFDATLNIARLPVQNVAALFALSPPSPPFQPALQSAPKDFSIQIDHRGGGMNAPYGLAIDQAGSVWVTNQGGPGIVKLSSNGSLLSGSAGFLAGGILNAKGVAIDTQGNVWVANTGANNVVKLTPAGAALTPPAGFNSGINNPVDIAMDTGDNAWVTNLAGSSVAKLNSSGIPATGSPYTAGGNLNQPDGIAIDAASNAWVSSSGNNKVFKLDNQGNNLSGTGFTDGGVQLPFGVAIDGPQTVYVANYTSTSLSAFNPNGTAAPGSPLTSTAIQKPARLSVSGTGKVWISNSQTNGTISNVFIRAVPSVGFGNVNTPVGIGVDNAGAIWTANSGSNSVTQFLGLTVPIITPIVSRGF